MRWVPLPLAQDLVWLTDSLAEFDLRLVRPCVGGSAGSTGTCAKLGSRGVSRDETPEGRKCAHRGNQRGAAIDDVGKAGKNFGGGSSHSTVAQ